MPRGKMMIEESKYAFRLLVHIANGDDYVQKISEITETSVPTLVRRLQHLEKEGFVISERQKEYNRRIYAVNWTKIVEGFIDYVSKTSQESLTKIKEFGIRRPDLEAKLKPMLKKSITDELKKDPGIKDCIRQLIRSIKDTNGYTLKHVYIFIMKSQMCTIESKNQKAKIVCHI